MSIVDRLESRNRPWLWLCLLTAIWLPVNLYSLNSYPASYLDEAWFAAPSVEFLKTGQLILPVFGLVYGRPMSFILAQGYNIALALVFKISGVGLAQGRMLSVVAIAVGGWLVFWAGSQLYRPAIGWLAGAVYLFSPRVLFFSHLIRPEALVNVGSLVCIAGFLVLRETRRPSHAFVLGLAAALALEVYVNVIYASIAVGLLTLFEFRRKADWNISGWFLAGGLIGGLFFIAAHLPVDFVALQQQARILGQITGLGEFLPGGLLTQMSYTVRYGLFGYSRLSLFEILAIATGLTGLLLNRQTQDGIVLYFGLAIWLGQFFPNKNPYHVVEMYPVFSLIIAGGNFALVRKLGNYFPKLGKIFTPLCWTLCSTLILAYAAAGLSLGYRSQSVDYTPAYRQLRALVPKQSSVLGDFRWWWPIYDEMFTADYYFNIPFTEGLDAAHAVQQVMRERQIDVVLLDEAGHIPEAGMLQFREALESYITQNCRLAGTMDYMIGVEFEGPIPRTTQVYLCSNERQLK